MNKLVSSTNRPIWVCLPISPIPMGKSDDKNVKNWITGKGRIKNGYDWREALERKRIWIGTSEDRKDKCVGQLGNEWQQECKRVRIGMERIGGKNEKEWQHELEGMKTRMERVEDNNGKEWQ